MARTTHVKAAQQRYATVPVIDPETGEQKVTPVLRKDGTPKLTKKGRPIVRRLTVADKSRPLDLLRCEKCGGYIEIGQPYKHITPKSGPYGGRQRNRCAACPGWRPSEVTGSTIKGIVYAAQETAEDQIPNAETVDDLTDILREVAEGYREAAEAARESATNIEDGFGHSTYQSEELNERADSLESAADEVENWQPGTEPDEDAIRTEAEEEVQGELLSEHTGEEDVDDFEALQALPDFDAAEYESRVEALVAEKTSEALEDARDEAREAIQNVEE